MLTPTPERERVWGFSEPTVDVSFSLFMRTGDLERLRSKPLTEQRIGVQEHTFSEGYLRSQHPDIRLEPSRDFVDGMRDLLQGRIDTFAHVTATGAYILEELRVGGITFAERPFANRVAGIAVPRANSELLGWINEALRDLKARRHV